MSMELAFCFVDCGDPFYRNATHEMIRSARRVMPDLKITQISDRKTPMHPEVDGIFQPDVDCAPDKVTLFKGHFMGTYAASATTDLIMCDVDLIWNKSAAPLFDDFGDGYVGLMHPDKLPCMPYSSTVMLSKRSVSWWNIYTEAIDDLDYHGMGAWHSDQVALTIAAEAWDKAHYLDADEVISVPVVEPIMSMNTYVTHFSGDCKKWLFDYARRCELRAA